MNLGYTLLFFTFMLNLSVPLTEALLGEYTTIPTSFDPSTVAEEFNATSIVSAWDWGGGGSIIGDVVGSLFFLFGKVRPMVAGFPDLITAMGAPTALKNFVFGFYAFAWFLSIIDFVRGQTWGARY